MTDILRTLILASQKSANVARSCCLASCAEALLIAEKNENEANTRFDKDFKTIADVLAQESAKSLIVSNFPELIDDVRGEECAEIGGVSIQLKDTAEETSELLSLLVPKLAAEEMARAAHCNLNSNLFNNLPSDLPILDTTDLGIWIDPIDGTAEFIAGVKEENKINNKSRLLCVTVLIGAYLKSTGEPIIGVINQPFFNNGAGRVIWGVQYGDTYKWSEEYESNDKEKTILMSAAEDTLIINEFQKSGWNVKSVAGAGNKLMKVALGEASAYLVSKATTFRWDTCAPHSVLRSKGGNVVNYKNYKQIQYNDEKNLETSEYCNKFGIIAYKNEAIFNEIMDVLS